jgi:hypothetical protein
VRAFAIIKGIFNLNKMENIYYFFFTGIGLALIVPFVYLCYIFNKYNQYKNADSWAKMLAWLSVIVFYFICITHLI